MHCPYRYAGICGKMYPDYSKKEKSDMVDAYKATKYSKNKELAVKKSIYSVIWSLTLVLYFIISFLTFEWRYTWILFLIAACLQAIVKLIFDLKSVEKDDVL